MEKDRDFNDFYSIQIQPFILIRDKITTQQKESSISIRDFEYQFANSDEEITENLEGMIFRYKGLFYKFNIKSKITKRYFGETMLMLVILRNKTNAQYQNADVTFSCKDHLKNESILRKILVPNFAAGNYLYFPSYIYLASVDYLLDIVIKFRVTEKRLDQEIKLDLMVQKQFKQSPRIALDVKLNYAMLDAEDPELLIQVLMSNIIHFGIKIVSIVELKIDQFLVVGYG